MTGILLIITSILLFGMFVYLVCILEAQLEHEADPKWMKIFERYMLTLIIILGIFLIVLNLKVLGI